MYRVRADAQESRYDRQNGYDMGEMRRAIVHEEQERTPHKRPFRATPDSAAEVRCGLFVNPAQMICMRRRATAAAHRDNLVVNTNALNLPGIGRPCGILSSNGNVEGR